MSIRGILPFQVELVPRADGTTGRGGLPLVVETMRALRLDQAVEKHLGRGPRKSDYGPVQKVEALVLLMAAGGECVDDIAVLKADEGLCRLLGRSMPSADTLLDFVYEFHDDALIAAAQKQRPPDTVAYIPAENERLQALGQVNEALVHAVAARGKSKRATLDDDATVIESHKQQAQPHYKGGRGYQPAIVYWGEQDLVVCDEFRDGNVPAGMANLPRIQRAFRSLPASVSEYYFRADSACYDERVLKWLANPEREGGPHGRIGFAISADMTVQLHQACVALPETAWQPFEERAAETVTCAEVVFAPGDWPKNAQPLRYVAFRIKKRQGLLFANGSDTRYLAVVSNRDELGAVQLLRWHWEKAGTIEHVHDVMKNELGAGVLPCSRFGANAAWYRLTALTYNALSALKSLALPPELSAARPKRLRFRVFNLAGRISEHAGRMWLRISEQLERLAGLLRARTRLAALLPAAQSG
jgi:hypothetical protein